MRRLILCIKFYAFLMRCIRIITKYSAYGILCIRLIFSVNSNLIFPEDGFR